MPDARSPVNAGPCAACLLSLSGRSEVLAARFVINENRQGIVAVLHTEVSHVFTCARLNQLYRAPEDYAAHPPLQLYSRPSPGPTALYDPGGHRPRVPGPRPSAADCGAAGACGGTFEAASNIGRSAARSSGVCRASKAWCIAGSVAISAASPILKRHFLLLLTCLMSLTVLTNLGSRRE